VTRSHRSSKLAWVVSVIFLGCSPQGDGTERKAAVDSPAALQSVGRTSATNAKPKVQDTAFARRLAEWQRDSSVLDSMTRSVRTDSLYRLYRHAVEPSGVSLAVFQEAWCEELQLSKRYGVVPARRAAQRMRDTVYQDRGIRDGFAYFASRSPSTGMVEGSKCRSHGGVFLDTIGRTPLDVELPPRPQPIGTR
jgi:hypothetical protein